MVKLHIQATGAKFWYLNNKRHRAKGPAMVFSSGNIIWCRNGKILSDYEVMMITSAEA